MPKLLPARVIPNRDFHLLNSARLSGRIGPIERLSLSPADAAFALGLSRSSIYLALGSGDLASVKIGKRRLITTDELRRYLLSHEAPTARSSFPTAGDGNIAVRPQQKTYGLHAASLETNAPRSHFTKTAPTALGQRWDAN